MYGTENPMLYSDSTDGKNVFYIVHYRATCKITKLTSKVTAQYGSYQERVCYQIDENFTYSN